MNHWHNIPGIRKINAKFPWSRERNRDKTYKSIDIWERAYSLMRCGKQQMPFIWSKWFKYYSVRFYRLRWFCFCFPFFFLVHMFGSVHGVQLFIGCVFCLFSSSSSNSIRLNLGHLTQFMHALRRFNLIWLVVGCFFFLILFFSFHVLSCIFIFAFTNSE